MKSNEKKEKEQKKKIKQNNHRAFTLIELLAVIIILGILLIIAIPSVTTYISNSRKSSYIDTVKSIIGAARNFTNDGKQEMFDEEVTYYVPVSCLKSENGTKTPYGEFSVAYVLVTYTGDGFDYYFTGTDTSKTGIKEVVSYDDLKEDDIESGVADTDIKPEIGIDGREKIEIFSDDCSSKEAGYLAKRYVDVDGYPIPIGDIPGHEYYNAGLDKYYGSLQVAVNEMENGQTIKVMGYKEETSTITIPSGFQVKLDFDGHTIYFSYMVERPMINNGDLILINNHEDWNPCFDMWSPVLNNGTITVNNNVIFRSENEAIENYGVVNVLGGQVFGYDADGISNHGGTINVSGGEVNGYSTGINNDGVVNITGGEVSGHYAITSTRNSVVNLSGDGVIKGFSVAVSNGGTFNSNGGKIIAKYPYHTHGFINSGTATLNNTTIETNASSRGFQTWGIQNESDGTMTLNSCTLNSASLGVIGIVNEGTMVLNNFQMSIVSTDSHGINATGLSLKGNSVTTIINGSSLSSTYSTILARDNYNLIIGENDGNVSSESPLIVGDGNIAYGMSLGDGGTVKFYDGKVIGGTNGGNQENCITGNQSNIVFPSGYALYKEVSNSKSICYPYIPR